VCGRYSITLPPEAIRYIFQTYGELPNWPAYYNAPPTTALPVVRQGNTGNRELVLMQCGLIRWFSKDGKPSYSTINARAEGIRTAASYREPFAKDRRCLVPASGYFEWTGPKNDRQPHYFTRADGQPMALAGLWDRWQSKDKSETKETFTIVTTEPSKFAAQFHNRMPLVLESNTWESWLRGDAETAASLMKPANEDALVSRRSIKLLETSETTPPICWKLFERWPIHPH
jgi:putative SOS response-associated peptidase YedK